MLRLMILRHAKAVAAAPSLADRERPLAPRGVKDAARMGAFLDRHKMLPEHVLVSPALRTRETWAALAGAWTAPPPATFEDTMYHADPGDLLALIRGRADTESCVMVIGHNPGLHELAVLLTASGEAHDRERLCGEFPTAALALIEFASERWADVHKHSGRLSRYLTPKMIETPVE